MPSKKKAARAYWDSCVFIHTIQQTPQHAGTLNSMMEMAEAGDLIIVTSYLTIAEVAKIGPNSTITDAQAQTLKDFFENEYFEFHQLDRIIGEMASDIVRKYGLKPPDAVHVATAIHRNVPVVHTFDEKMLSRDGSIGPGLKIKPPSIPKLQSGLFRPEYFNRVAAQ